MKSPFIIFDTHSECYINHDFIDTYKKYNAVRYLHFIIIEL